MSRKPVLVTGGAGFIGSTVAELLLNAGFPVVIVDNLSRGFVEALPAGAVFHHLDLQDTQGLRQVIIDHQIHAVVHCAALIRVCESVTNPELYFENNTAGTQSLLTALTGTRVRQLIFSSTAAVYGETPSGIVSENSPLAPLNPYGQSKMLAETLIREFAETSSQIDYLILRYFNVAGAITDQNHGPRDPDAKQLIRRLAQAALGVLPQIELFGQDYPTDDGTCLRDFIHIKDLADAHLAALTYLQKGSVRDTLNLGYGRGYSVMACLHTMQTVVKKEIPHTFVQRRVGDPTCVLADSSKAKELLGLEWQHQDLFEICRDSYDWESQLFHSRTQKDLT